MRLTGCIAGRVVIVLVQIALGAALTAESNAQSMTVDPSSFSSRTCQQLWYIEQETLAAGRVCLKTERARRAFRRAERCISVDEDILRQAARDYLRELRETARMRRCPEF